MPVTLFRRLEETVAEQIKWATTAHPRISIGYDFFDRRTGGGAAEGEVIQFLARTQVGKTAVACNIVRFNREVPTVFFSLEMHGRYIAQRLAAIHGNVGTRQIEEDLATTGQSSHLNQLIVDFPQLSIVDKPGLSVKAMSVALAEATEAWGVRPRLVVIDFMELIGGVPGMDSISKVEKLAPLIKDFSRSEDVCTFILHQVGRGAGGNGDQPLSLLSGRYGGEQSADYVLAGYRPCLAPGIDQQTYEALEDQIYFQFLKTRSGGGTHPGGMRHRIDPVTMRITPNPEGSYRPESYGRPESPGSF